MVVVVVSCVAQADNIIAAMTHAVSNGKVFMNHSTPICCRERTEPSEIGSTGLVRVSLVVHWSRAFCSTYFTFNVIFFVRFPSSLFVE